MLDGVARGDGSVAEALANVAGSGADIALSNIIACRVEIPRRAGTVGIAACKGQRKGEEA